MLVGPVRLYIAQHPAYLHIPLRKHRLPWMGVEAEVSWQEIGWLALEFFNRKYSYGFASLWVPKLLDGHGPSDFNVVPEGGSPMDLWPLELPTVAMKRRDFCTPGLGVLQRDTPLGALPPKLDAPRKTNRMRAHLRNLLLLATSSREDAGKAKYGGPQPNIPT
ncbi:hypothetical protein BDZ45DRAFT_809675 [Acephala macrosclerotiorum]|nr:hypothetical protein BDZ45DRAFT_809675 [Acephala macrosclerotiorum]